jgi:hypothetical protein
MSLVRLRNVVLLAAAGLGLSACGYDRYGYGYGGLSIGVGSGGYCDPYYGDCYYGRGSAYSDPWYGWYGDYYYPGFGIYVYDHYRRPHRWNDDHRHYWEGRRGRFGDRNWNDRRWERWDGWDRNGRRDWRGDGRSGGRDRSSRQDWNQTQGVGRQGVRAEPRVQGETRVRTEGTRVRGEGTRSRGEWRGRSGGTRSSGDRRGRRN